MVLFLILMSLFGLTMLFSAGLAVFGVVKKKKKMVITGGICFLAGLAGIGIISVIYTRDAYAYFQGESVAAQNQPGSEAVSLSKGLSESIGNDDVSGLSAKANSLRGKSIQAVNNSGNAELDDKDIFLNELLTHEDVRITRAEIQHKDDIYSVSITILFEKKFSGKLKLSNYNREGRLIESAEKITESGPGTSKDVEFEFRSSDFIQTKNFILMADDGK